MDLIKLKRRISEGMGKYKYAWIVLLMGIVLMVIPVNDTKKESAEFIQPIAAAEEIGVEEQLEEILGHVEGAGSVKVMLAVLQGERTIYQTDSTYIQGENNSDTRTQTILITDSERNEAGLVHQKNPPTYQGAIILAQGADNPSVKLAIVDAVSDVTGLGADKISVLKMQ